MNPTNQQMQAIRILEEQKRTISPAADVLGAKHIYYEHQTKKNALSLQLIRYFM